MKLLLNIRYDGRGYCGFQAQPNGTSVQAVLTETFSRLLGFPCDITGCSRTDSGVHARQFCAALQPHEEQRRGENWCPIPAGKIHRAVNILLPDDIAVTAAAVMPDDFHPRYNAAGKTYEYHIRTHPARDPFTVGRTYHVSRPVNEEGFARMREVCALLRGKHDFAAFMASGSKITDTVRTVTEAEVFREDSELIFTVTADGFLYNMVRIMAGTLLDCAWGRKTVGDVRQALITGDRTKAGFTAPPGGLFLCRVHYDREIPWECE